jgi:methionyl-tRNA formyltransferase
VRGYGTRMDVIVCGFGRLATECLKELIAHNFNIVYILTHKEHQESSVDTFAIEHQIEFSYEDTRKNINKFTALFGEMKPDYLISVNYRYIIPDEVFTIPGHAINIHGSLLPQYRGRTPHVWSIINGEEFSGITCHLIESGVDTGPIVEQYRVQIEEDDTGYTLLQKFTSLYPTILLSSLRKLLNGEALIEQDESQSSYFGKRTPDMGYIDFYKTSNQVINFVRAQAYPYPGAYYYLPSGKKIIVNKLTAYDDDKEKSTLTNKIGVIKQYNNQYFVRCIDAVLIIIEYEIND